MKGKKVPRLVKIIFFQYLARILCVELTSTAKRKQQQRMAREEEAMKMMMNINNNNNNNYNYNYFNSKTAQSTSNFQPFSQQVPSPQQKPPQSTTTTSANTRPHRSHHHHRHHHHHRRHHHSHSRGDPPSHRSCHHNKPPPTSWSSELVNSYLELTNMTETPMYSSSTKQQQRPYMATSNPNLQKLILKPSSETEPTDEPLLLGHSRQQKSEKIINVTDDSGSRYRRRSATSVSGGPPGEHSRDEVLLELNRVLTRQFGPLVEALSKTIESGERRQRERRYNEIIQDEWSDVAMISDHILCYFFCLLTLACCFLIFFHSPHVLAEW